MSFPPLSPPLKIPRTYTNGLQTSPSAVTSTTIPLIPPMRQNTPSHKYPLLDDPFLSSASSPKPCPSAVTSTTIPLIPPMLQNVSTSHKYPLLDDPFLSSASSPKAPPSWAYNQIGSQAKLLASPVNSPACPSQMTSLAATIEENQCAHQVQTASNFVIEYKSNGRGNYHRMDPGMSKQIKDYLNKSLVAFWVKNAGTFFLLDFETMQQFNVSTGFRRSIRFRGSCIPKLSGKRKRHDMNRVDSIDLTNSACAPIHTPQSAANSVPISLVAQQSASVGMSSTISAEKNATHQPQIEVCGPAYKTAVRCGQVARRKLAQIRWLQLSRCKFVQDMRTLPQKQRLFNPDPIPEEDKRFPIEQVRHLERGGITVHEILPSVTWSRNRRHFEMLHDEEQQLYSGHGTSTNPAKIKHFAWHGAPAECIRGILEYGFLVGPAPRVGNRYGHGVYLSTEAYGRYSMNPTYSQPDVSGFRFMLLCEVLPGTVEASKSQQTRPSSLNVHSGVDQLPGATMHVFYTYDMNVRISPKYLVVIHPPVTDTIMSLVPNELQVAMAETNDPSDVVLIDCT